MTAALLRNEALDALEGVLELGEELLWSGKPRRPGLVKQYLACSFVLLWLLLLLVMGGPWHLFLGPSFIVLSTGIYQPYELRKAAKETTYALTRQRLLVVRKKDVRSIPLTEIKDVLLREATPTSCDVVAVVHPPRVDRSHWYWWVFWRGDVKLELGDNASQVWRLIKSTRESLVAANQPT